MSAVTSNPIRDRGSCPKAPADSGHISVSTQSPMSGMDSLIVSTGIGFLEGEMVSLNKMFQIPVAGRILLMCSGERFLLSQLIALMLSYRPY